MNAHAAIAHILAAAPLSVVAGSVAGAVVGVVVVGGVMEAMR